jgi:hypothetical protein
MLNRFRNFRYQIFFLTIILIFAIGPFLDEKSMPVAAFSFLFMMLAVLWTLDLKKGLFRFCLTLACLSFVLNTAHVLGRSNITKELNITLGEATLITYTIFIGIAIFILIKKLFSEKKVTVDTIQGGSSVYLLMGIFWAFVYHILIIADPGAISFSSSGEELSSILYFSFTTLTTLGYGDITPVSWVARNLTTLEAVIGQLFLAIFVARLVGLYIATHRNEK